MRKIKTIVSIIFLTLLIGSVFYVAGVFGIKLKQSINEKNEVDSLYKVKLQLEIKSLTPIQNN